MMVVVDRLSKYAHLLSFSHPYIAILVVRIFLNNIFKLHGLPQSIVSEKDPVFTSQFWKELFRISGTELPFAEYAYNTSEHTSTKISPYKVVYGQPPPWMLPYEPGSTTVQAVDEELKSKELINKFV